MNRQLTRLTLAIACALPFAAAQAQPAPSTKSTQVQAPAAVLASKLIGKKVTNAAGQDLGEVQDLAVDLRGNKVHYALLDAQNRRFAYPLAALRWSADGNKVLINATEQQLEKAPRMNLDKRGIQAGDTAYWNEAYDYWRVVDRDTASKVGANTQMVWASKLIGWNVQASNGKDSIGEVEDLVIDPRSGAVKFAAVDFNDKIGGKDAGMFDDRLHPLPLDAFATREGGDDLVLEVDRSKLQPSQGFDDDKFDSRLSDSAFIDKAARYADGLTPAAKTTGQR